MLNVNDWRLWLNSSETITAMTFLRRIKTELQEGVSNGALLQSSKIAVQYAHAVGIIEGITESINLIENIAEEIENAKE